MSSSVKPIVIFEKWNRKLHYYLGLYFLFFLWLFSLTGLILNHGSWAMAMGGNDRREMKYERSIRPPLGTNHLERARDVMRQLDLRGEIDVAPMQPAGQFAFSVNRPKDASQVKVDFTQNRATVQHFENSRWATFRIFHTFSGSRFNQPESQRDWIVTTLWVLAMDALAGGLIVMVLGSYYMWFRLKKRHVVGWTVLASGVASCALFLRGLF